MPKEVTPSREEVRSDDGGEPELGGDGGEKVRRRERESDGESERRVAETEERSTGIDFLASGGREGGRRGRKPAAEFSAAIEDVGETRGIQIGRIRGRERGKRGANGRGNHGGDFPPL